MPAGAVFCTQCGSRSTPASTEPPANLGQATPQSSGPEAASPFTPAPTEWTPAPPAAPFAPADPSAPANPGGLPPVDPSQVVAPQPDPTQVVTPQADPTQVWTPEPAASQQVIPPPAPYPSAPPAGAAPAAPSAPPQVPYGQPAPPVSQQPYGQAPMPPGGGWAQGAQAAPAAAPSGGGSNPIGGILGVLGGAAVIAGSFLAWMTITPSGGEAESITGWNLTADAKTMVAIGAVGLIFGLLALAAKGGGLARLVLGAAGLGAIGLGAFDTYDILKRVPDQDFMAVAFPQGAEIAAPEIGLIVVFVGGAVLLLAALLGKPKRAAAAPPS